VIERPGATNPMIVSGDEVRKAQQALKNKGYDPGKISGTLDTETQQAVRKFQQDNNLLATGILDEKTAAKLGIDIKKDAGSNRPGHIMPDHQAR